ncbi:MAG: hypothetical protein ACE5FI_09270 [Anaerolineales bacterium]
MRLKHWIRIAPLLLLALLLALQVVIVDAQSGDAAGEYFDATGHFVGDPFLSFYNEHGGVLVFGYPITERFFDYRLGREVQYFERARLELWPEHEGPYRVQLGLLADELGLGLPAAAPVRDPNCSYFIQTGHSACLAFADFFEQRGGVDVFGYTTSEYRVVDGRLVQSFQRAVLEWHPELPRGSRVQIANLGARNFDQLGYNPALTEPFLSANIDASVTTLTVAASPRLPVVGQDEEETVFVVIRDQLGEPVAGAVSQVLVDFPSEVQTFTLAPSNAAGVAKVRFSVTEAVPGSTVSIEVLVHHLGLRATTRTSFIPWW